MKLKTSLKASNLERGRWIDPLCALHLAHVKEMKISNKLLDTVEQYFPTLYRSHFARFSIKSGIVSSSAALEHFSDYIRRRHDIMKATFEGIAGDLPDLSLELYLGDGFLGWSGGCPCPVFAFSRHRQFDPGVLLLPDPLSLSQGDALREQVARGNALFSWKDKTEKAFWRGTTTGEWLSVADYARNPRFRLVEESVAHPNEIDAGFTGFHENCPLELREWVERRGLLRSWVGISEHMNYKYLVLVDGFTTPWPRDLWSLHSNSLVVKQESDIEGWFYPLLHPKTHYLPVLSDLSNIKEVVLYARELDDKMRPICVNAQLLSRSVLDHDGLLAYIKHLLLQYSRLYGN